MYLLYARQLRNYLELTCPNQSVCIRHILSAFSALNPTHSQNFFLLTTMRTFGANLPTFDVRVVNTAVQYIHSLHLILMGDYPSFSLLYYTIFVIPIS